MACEKCAEKEAALNELEAALRSHRRERDRYEKASEVAMQALHKEVTARQADVTELLAALDSVIDERDKADDELREAKAKRAKLEAAITSICQKVAARLTALPPIDSYAYEIAKEVVRGILEELSPGTTLDEILKAAEE